MNYFNRPEENGISERKKKKSLFHRTAAWLHLYLGIFSSAILIFVCLTGTIVVFCDEIIDYFNQDAMYVKEIKNERVPTEILLENVKAQFPDRFSPSYLISYKDPARTVKFNQYSKTDGLRFVYADPYTGRVVKDDGTIYFFFITAHLHNSLLLGKTGEWIVDISAIIFLIGIITGFILWVPKKWTKATRHKSFLIKTNGTKKRLNYDLHNVAGFYALSILLVLTLTGLLIAFKPLSDATVQIFGGDPSHDWENLMPEYNSNLSFAPMNDAISDAFAKDSLATAVQIFFPRKDSATYYGMATASQVGLKSYIGSMSFIDKYTSKEITLPESSVIHEKVENAYWMLHMGAWMGLTGKIITFTGGLIATSLPVTGFIIWWGRRKKKPLFRRKKKTIVNNTF